MNLKLNPSECSVYPGLFVPLFKDEDFKMELKKVHGENTVQPPVNITESLNSFRVEIAIPGVEREEFLVQADENMLSVYVVHKKAEPVNTQSFQLHEFDYDFFERNIVLPENADAQFVSAEYKAGILRLHVPKIQKPLKNVHTRIAVY